MTHAKTLDSRSFLCGQPQVVNGDPSVCISELCDECNNEVERINCPGCKFRMRTILSILKEMK